MDIQQLLEKRYAKYAWHYCREPHDPERTPSTIPYDGRMRFIFVRGDTEVGQLAGNFKGSNAEMGDKQAGRC